MQKKYFYSTTIILLGFLCLNFINISAQCQERYFTDLFEPPEDSISVEYGKNIKSNGVEQTLFMDIYEPADDNQTCRPVIFVAFGGSFIRGSTTDLDINYICKKFTRKGYVAIAIDYRLESGIENLSNSEKMVKALVRAVHDGKAAIRYLRKNAIDGNNDYGVDPDQIYFAGISAGALLGIHLAYMDLDDPFEEEWVEYIEDLGGLEGDSGTPGYSSEVSGIINIAGAIGGLEFIEEGDVPIISFHSNGDNVVPFNTGYPLGYSALPLVYGSFHINNRMEELGIETSLFEYDDNFHPPYFGDNEIFINVIDDIVLNTEGFLYNLVQCNDCPTIDTTIIGINDLIQFENVDIFPNPTAGLLNVKIEGIKSDGVEWSLIDQAGKSIGAGFENGDQFALDLSEFSSGFYFLKLETEDRVSVEKVILK